MADHGSVGAHVRGGAIIKLRVGFIGAGAITDLHYLGYKDNPKAELHAICDVDEALLRRRASDWKIRKTYTDYRQLLADPDVDAVEVITPHNLHAEMGIAALEAGKHVSVQKPMAITVTECDALIEAAQRAGKLMRVFENFRFYPPLMKAKELLDAGAIGEPLSIRLKCVQGTSGEGWERYPTGAGYGASTLLRAGEGGSSSTTVTTFFPSPGGTWARWKRCSPGSRTALFSMVGCSTARRSSSGNTGTPKNTAPTKLLRPMTSWFQPSTDARRTSGSS